MLTVGPTSFENEVNEAVKVALSSLFPDTKPNKKNPKGKTTTTHEGAITVDVIT